MPISYHDSFIEELCADVAGLIEGDASKRSTVEKQLFELAVENSESVSAYWRTTTNIIGIPDSAFKLNAPYLFPHQEPAKIFRTSGTSGDQRGSAAYSPKGMELMNLSILRNASDYIAPDLDSPAIIRLVPSSHSNPEMVMAYGMELIGSNLGHPDLSDTVIGEKGLNIRKLRRLLQSCIAEEVPVVLIGGSFAFVHCCEAFESNKERWELPKGSRMVDAGGFKGRSTTIDTDELRKMVYRTFCIDPHECLNLFGMTELSSQLYDSCDRRVGPNGERPKGRQRFVDPRVRDYLTMELKDGGIGLLEVADLCIIDRPYLVLTGDFGMAEKDGVAIVGRIRKSEVRGCSVGLEGVAIGR